MVVSTDKLAVSMLELEEESGELLPKRETLQVITLNPAWRRHHHHHRHHHRHHRHYGEGGGW